MVKWNKFKFVEECNGHHRPMSSSVLLWPQRVPKRALPVFYTSRWTSNGTHTPPVIVDCKMTTNLDVVGSLYLTLSNVSTFVWSWINYLRFLKKPKQAYFVYFPPLLNTMTNGVQNLNINGTSIDGMHGIWTRDCRMVSANESTELLFAKSTFKDILCLCGLLWNTFTIVTISLVKKLASKNESEIKKL